MAKERKKTTGSRKRSRTRSQGEVRIGHVIRVRTPKGKHVKASRRAAARSLGSQTMKAVEREAASGADAALIAQHLGISITLVNKHLAELAARAQKDRAATPPKPKPKPSPARTPADPAPPPATATRTKSQTNPHKKKRHKRGNRPPPTEQQREAVERERQRRLAHEETHSARLRSLPAGTSELEELAATGRHAAALQRIDELAARKDDPIAWVALAMAYRSRTLRRPAAEAIQQVGPEKVLRIVQQDPSGHWGTELMTFLVNAAARERSRGPVQRELLPHERPGGVWWSD